MKKKTILLTGDDGYNSLGTRVLVHYLKNEFILTIAGTLKQQSGVGGHKHIMEGGSWGEDMVDGIPALWLDGSPVDVMEAARVHFSKPFDYCISGINWGTNIDGCLYSSGTFSAAYYAKTLGLARKVIAISWDLPSKHHFVRHAHSDSLEQFLIHPGESAHLVLQKTLAADLWGADIVNINIPTNKTDTIEYATPLSSSHGFWPLIILDNTTHLFSYGHRDHSQSMGDVLSETQVLQRNHIAVVPCQATMFDKPVYKEMVKSSNIK